MKPLLLIPVLVWTLVFLLPDPSLLRHRYPGTRTVLFSFLAPLVLWMIRTLFSFPYAPEDVVPDVAASVLALILLPVPYDGRRRIRILEWVALMLPFLSLAGLSSVLTASALMALSLIHRGITAFRSKEDIRAVYRSHRYRHALYEAHQSSLWMLWASLLVLSFCGKVSAIVSLVLFITLYAALVAGYASGNPLSFHPEYERSIRCLAEQNETPEGEVDEEPERALFERCCRYMADKKPFLVESFSLADLSNAVFTNKTYLSRTINRQAGKNFRQFLNEYRVAYSKDLFMKNMSLKVNDLAELSGFHTITTYTMAFKVVMDESPSSWCRRMRIKSLK